MHGRQREDELADIALKKNASGNDGHGEWSDEELFRTLGELTVLPLLSHFSLFSRLVCSSDRFCRQLRIHRPVAADGIWVGLRAMFVNGPGIELPQPFRADFALVISNPTDLSVVVGFRESSSPCV